MAHYKVISVAGTNEDVISADPVMLDGWYLVNEIEVMRYVKLFDASSSPTLSVTGPKLTLGVPGFGAANVGLESPLEFGTGLCIAIVSGPEIGNVGAVTADDIAVNLFYE